MKNSIKYIIAGLFALVFAGQIFASISNQSTSKAGCTPGEDPEEYMHHETF